MDKIETTLFKNINAKPKDSFDVILCTTIDNTFNNTNWLEVMDGIYSAKLTGEDIKKLATHKDILSIESDSEMGIL